MKLSTTTATAALALALGCPVMAQAQEAAAMLRMPADADPQALAGMPTLTLPPGVLAHWRPWTAGHWGFGAAVGLRQPWPGPTGETTGLTLMPMFSYEQAHYRVSLGLVPPDADRGTTVMLGLSIPLR